MKKLTEKQAWLALAEAIYGCERLPHFGRQPDSYLRINSSGDAYTVLVMREYWCTGLCDAVSAMRVDDVIDFPTSIRMLGRLERICDTVEQAYLFPRSWWEPRVDLCLTMYKELSCE